MELDKDPSGVPTESPSGTEVEKKQTVAYETYRKALNQEKNLRAQLAEMQGKLSEYDTKIATANEEKLLEDNELRKVIELRDSKINELNEALSNISSERDQWGQQLVRDRRERAFLDSLPGKLKRNEYLNLAGVDDIVFADGEIDTQSVESVVNRFVEEHGESLLDYGKVPHLPGKAAIGTVENLPSYEAWKNMTDVAEKRRLMPQVMQRELNNNN